MRRLLLFLAIGMLGVVLLLAGLVWDALLHADDPGLAVREGVFSFSNPGHALLALGIAAAMVGLLGAGDAALSLRPGGRWNGSGLRVAAAALALFSVSGTAIAGTWATTRGHDHSDEGSPIDPAAFDHDHHEPVAVATPDRPTPSQQAAADKLLADTKRSTARWATVEGAEADGYRAITPVFNGIQHWHNDRFHGDGRVLDPAAPEELVYAATTRGMVLVAAMYMMPTTGEAGPAVGGPLTVWHDHTDLCFRTDGRVVGFYRPPTLTCPSGSFNVPTPEMLHVWVVDNPAGPFAPEMTPSALVAVAEGS